MNQKNNDQVSIKSVLEFISKYESFGDLKELPKELKELKDHLESKTNMVDEVKLVDPKTKKLILVLDKSKGFHHLESEDEKPTLNETLDELDANGIKVVRFDGLKDHLDTKVEKPIYPFIRIEKEAPKPNHEGHLYLSFDFEFEGDIDLDKFKNHLKKSTQEYLSQLKNVNAKSVELSSLKFTRVETFEIEDDEE